MIDKPRLIERAFPLKQASLDSVHEKNLRHGHISTLHIWPVNEKRSIEVKGRSGTGDVEVLANEWAKACNLRDEYRLYVSTTAHSQPATCPRPGFLRKPAR